MKTYIFILTVVLSVNFACKTQHKIDKSTTVNVEVSKGITLGTVSHQYSKTGCATVVVISKKGQQKITLIPVDALPNEYDTDGLEIYFNYRTLRIKNPEGCTVGIPAMFTDISKK